MKTSNSISIVVEWIKLKVVTNQSKL